MSFGPWHAPAMKMPSVIVATGSSLGCRSMNQPSMLHEMPNFLADLLGVGARLQPGRQDHHVDRDAPLLADQRVFHLDDQLALFAGQAGGVGHLGHLAAHEDACPPPARCW